MQSNIEDWEKTLLQLATLTPIQPHHITLSPISDYPLLSDAYARCEAITAHHSKSFHLATRLLPKEKRQAICALYAFCRTVDDIADLSPDSDQALRDLTAWREYSVNGSSQSMDDPVLIAWTKTRTHYHIPVIYVEQLLDTLIQDLHKHRYRTFDELSVYCYGVASTVGLMSMHIIGYSEEEALCHAVKLGVALQMTNILRDVREDWLLGRLYLPLEELESFGLDESAVAAARVTKKWKAFMRFQVERTRRIYQSAMTGIRYLHPSGRLSVAAAATFYSGILQEIEKQDYDVFSQRARVSRWGKLRRVPGLWVRCVTGL